MALRKRLAFIAAVLGVFIVALGPGLVIAANSNVSIKEVSDKYAFQPGTISVAVGDSVTWTNNSDAPHTVTADDDSWGSDQLGEADTFMQTFDTAGTYAYHCEIHDYMHGTVTVLAAGQTPPSTDTTTPAGASAGGALPWLWILAAFGSFVVLFAWLLGRRTRGSQGTAP